jgi:putative membrane protein
MITEIFIAILLGCTAGIITGLIPGIHVNLISLLVLSFSGFLLEITSPLIVSIFIISMAITHTFLDTIPAVFLGAPEADTALSVLPGHKLLLEGKGYHAIILTLIGSLFSIMLAIIFSPIIAIVINKIYPTLSNLMGYILIIASLFLISKDSKSKYWAFIIFLLAGTLGIATLNLTNLKNPLFPLLSGMFGVSGLLISLNQKVKIPKQIISKLKIKKKTISQAVGASFISGSLCSFMPGLGPSQAAILGSQLTKKMESEGFLILVGGLNTVNMVMSFIALYILDKARNGAIVTISKIMESFTLSNLILFFGVALVVAGIATFLTINLTKIFSKLMSKVDYTKICIFIIAFIFVLTLVLSGKYGILILLVSTSLGIVPPLIGVGRNHLMGCLLLPVILYFI